MALGPGRDILNTLLAPLRILMTVNSAILSVGRALAWMALGLMVLIILYQVIMRYVFNSAPNWSEEAARFLMLWMTAFIAPSAYRWGGFVSIDMLLRMLPKVLASIGLLILLVISTIVLWTAVTLGYDHVFSFVGRGNSASLRIPLDLFGGERIRFQNNWMFSSLFVCVIMLFVINVELVLRTLVAMTMPDAKLPHDGAEMPVGAE